RVCVAAFSEQRMRRLRGLIGPRLCSSASPREVTALVSAATITGSAKASSTKARSKSPYQCLQVPESHGRVKILTRRFLSAAHARGLKVHVWTIDDPVDMNRLLDMGVDGIFTDQPSVLKAVLIDRGQWT
ncbi:MAG TPA: glycerophosphodiester phosphodiesterase family protein, partial [Microthrixaceae bacterium]|nr:glycerophosphodiester phosphodiesterase family protein [Microthrixaceae bacterium]